MSADVADSALVEDSAKIWHLAQVRENAVIGANVVVGRGAYIGAAVRVGMNSKVQNYALVYEPAVIEDGVFIGPNAVLTNDKYPRAVDVDGVQKSADKWNLVGVLVCEGASVGAGAICVGPLRIGRYAMVAAGAVVVHDVPDYALVAGVPARMVAWIGADGKALIEVAPKEFKCQATSDHFLEVDGKIHRKDSTE